ncbi:MAG: FHA domain-containing protein [Bacteroidaceae bacterium]|nr:FHA domain-containing protein [Bacteroidaceae bacterium]
MANLFTCPKCKAQIEDDSWYCDQCGAELMVCPSGHGIGRGKMCGVCGTALVAARQLAAGLGGQAAAAQQMAYVPPQPTMQPSGSAGYHHVAGSSLKPMQPQTTVQSLPEPGHITCAQIGRIRISPGLHIGRENSPYAEYLLPFRQISRRHALFNKTGDRWTVTDLGSSCGTMVNRVPCTPNVPMPFKVGDVITFYDLDFFVSE